MSEIITAITAVDWSAIWAAITTITTAIAGVVAAIQNSLKNKAANTTEQVIAFYDPNDTTQMTPPENVEIPDKSWKMSDSTKANILSGKSDEDKLSIINQINNAESSGYVDYNLIWSGGYYVITYGLIAETYTKTSVQNTSLTHYKDSNGNISVKYSGKAVESNTYGDSELGNAREIFEDAIANGKVQCDGITEYSVKSGEQTYYFTANQDGSYSFHSPWALDRVIPL